SGMLAAGRRVCLASHPRLPRGKVAHPAGDAVGLTGSPPNLPIIDAKFVGADLRQYCLHPLSDRSRAGHDLDSPGGIHRGMHAIERSQSALLDEHGETAADHLTGGAPSFEVVAKGPPLGPRPRPIEQSALTPRI